MKKDQKGTNLFFFVIFILLYSLFYRPIDGDFWHYLETYNYGVSSSEHMEGFYNWLMTMIPNNYLLWRLVIWLPAAIIIALVFKLMDVPNSYAVTFFLAFGLSAYYYTRNALALSVLYLGMALFSVRNNYNKRLLYVILFALLTFASWFLHKSMPLYIGIALVSLIIPFNKHVFIGLLIAFPLLYGVIITIGSDLLNMTALWIQEGTGFRYLEAESSSYTYNWKGIIYLIISYAPVIYFFIIAFFKPIPNTDSDFVSFKAFLFFSFLVIYVSYLFYEQGSEAIQRRIYKSSMIPFAYAVALYFKHNMGSKQCTIFIYLTLLSILGPMFLDSLRSL